MYDELSDILDTLNDRGLEDLLEILEDLYGDGDEGLSSLEYECQKMGIRSSTLRYDAGMSRLLGEYYFKVYQLPEYKEPFAIITFGKRSEVDWDNVW